MNSKYWLDKIMDTMYGDSGNKFFIGLSSAIPNYDGTGVDEPDGNYYAREEIEEFTDSKDGVIKNVDAIEFNRSTGVWFPSTAKAKCWVLFDAATGGNVLSWGELDEEKTIESNTAITIPAEALSITLTNHQAE